jgi:two-component sensor histidine kinase
VILLAALALAEVISRRSIRSLVNLSSMTQALPKRLLSEEATIDWPKTNVSEIRQLIANFREMAQSLTTQFTAVKQSNELLEIRVQKRTYELQASLKDREALLKEVHHRVKNNMQVITSLLRMEGRRSVVSDTKAVLGDMQARIRAMALLHESLYRTGTFASVDLGSYLKQLATQAFQTVVTDTDTIELKLNLGSVQVGMDQAIPCGLLLNELISNSLKHGFPVGVTGHVSIDLRPLDTSNEWQLRLCDTGIGLPENFEEKRKNSLGLQLVGDLARQIGGELQITPNADRGVAFAVNFQVLEPAPLVMPV